MKREWEDWERERTMDRRIRVVRMVLIGTGIAIVASLILTRLNVV